MAEELNEQEVLDKEAEASVARQNKIAKMAVDYYDIVNGHKLNSMEQLQIGMDTVLAGFSIISKACTTGELPVSDSYACIERTLLVTTNVVKQVYLNEDNIAKMIANAKASQFEELKMSDLNKVETN